MGRYGVTCSPLASRSFQRGVTCRTFSRMGCRVSRVQRYGFFLDPARTHERKFLRNLRNPLPLRSFIGMSKAGASWRTWCFPSLLFCLVEGRGSDLSFFLWYCRYGDSEPSPIPLAMVNLCEKFGVFQRKSVPLQKESKRV